MSLNRDACFLALFNLVTQDSRAVAQFVTMKRLLKHHADVDASDMPALFMFQLPETRQYKGKGIPAIRTLHCIFAVYYNAPDPDATLPATLLNTAADIIDDIISEPGNPQNTQTLGGLVEHVYIEPSIENYEGLLQQDSILVAHVAMLVP